MRQLHDNGISIGEIQWDQRFQSVGDIGQRRDTPGLAIVIVDDVPRRLFPVRCAEHVVHGIEIVGPSRAVPIIIGPGLPPLPRRIEPLRQLANEGVLGAVADNVFSCMGAVYSKRRVDEELAPAMYEAFASEGVDAAYLVPL